MSRYAVALALASIVAVAASAAHARALAPACLHGASEKAEQRSRRLAALEYAKNVNELEAAGKYQAERFYMIEDLPLLPPLPPGFKARMSNDGGSYAFSLKDTLDPCGFAYFSDEDGIVYSAMPVR